MNKHNSNKPDMKLTCVSWNVIEVDQWIRAVILMWWLWGKLRCRWKFEWERSRRQWHDGLSTILQSNTAHMTWDFNCVSWSCSGHRPKCGPIVPEPYYQWVASLASHSHYILGFPCSLVAPISLSLPTCASRICSTISTSSASLHLLKPPTAWTLKRIARSTRKGHTGLVKHTEPLGIFFGERLREGRRLKRTVCTLQTSMHLL